MIEARKVMAGKQMAYWFRRRRYLRPAIKPLGPGTKVTAPH
jgi:hypothetical protein